MLTESERAALLAYCRLEEPSAEELLVLEGLHSAAEEYMANAGVAKPAEGTSRRAQYDLCVHSMVLLDFDQRDAQVSGTVSDNPAFRRMLTQLKLTEPAGEEE